MWMPLINASPFGYRNRYSRGGVTITTGKMFESADNSDSLEEKQWYWRWELESLVGLLHHTATVEAPGWSFLRHMIALLKGICHRNHHIWLNKEFKADLQWWLTFMETWNRISVLPLPHPCSCGCVALCNNQCFQLQWPRSCQDNHIS